ncbi:murein biosynthesis integral membrane protein MurJ [Paraliobacillus sediminis]|uniref:murein biosynthesis integral membrane protein MurJ n=1 Tax=Paraliobacillus sediminis TaxID=1885916 RepID=UPI000E3BDD4F|nr:murein biosynthesis integral membrane protein MurJ [Paraliobacillus sediminis]
MKGKIAITSIIFILATLVLKITGLLRDIVVAYYFGDSYQADAYLAAFIIPNMLFLFLTTGMKNAFVPQYIESLEQNRSRKLFNQIWKATGITSLLFAILGICLSPIILPLVYANFEEVALEITIHVTMIFMSALVFVGINAVLEAYLDAENRYTLSIISQNIVLITMITSAILFVPEIGTYALAIGYLAGTIISLLFKLFFIIPKKIIKITDKIDFPEVKSFFIILFPVAITVMVGQVNLAVDNIFASYFEEGVVTYINYAKNLVHFPQSIFGVTIGTIVFPLIAKAYAKQDIEGFKAGTERGLTVMFYVLLPAIVGMLLLMPTIIQLLFERGAFDQAATIATSKVAYYYAGSVLFFSLNIMINNGLYTIKKGHLIMMIGLFSIVLNAICNLILTNWMGYVGIPLASSIVGLSYAGTCYLVFRKHVGPLVSKVFVKESLKVMLAVGVMAGGIILLRSSLPPISAIIDLILSVSTGVVVYLVCSYVLKIKSFQFLLKHVKRTEG